MRRLMIGLCALAAWSATLEQARAAWNNAFQPTLFGRSRTPSSSFAAPAVVYASPAVTTPVAVAATPVCNNCNSAPQQNCSTSYTQRCYYQPVTTYETRSHYEPVTTYQKSYYYEPVTSYRYSCYYDPCTCQYQQVATPVTSYQLREKCCPVQSWVQRCTQVPVTSYQKACYWQPQTTCCQTTMGAPIPICPKTGAPITNGAPSTPPSAPPSITPTPGPGSAPPSVNEHREGGDKSYYQQQQQPPYKPMGTPNVWQPAPGTPAFPTTSPVAPPPPVKLDRIVVGPDATVEGQVVRSDNTPRPNARVVFVSSNRPAQQTVTANSAGRFQVSLTPGAWNVYVHGADGNPVFHSRIDVNAASPAQIRLASR